MYNHNKSATKVQCLLNFGNTMKYLVNQKKTIEFNSDVKVDIIKLSDTEYRIQKGPQHLRAFLIKNDPKTKNSSWWINGIKYNVNSKSGLDEMLEKLGMDDGSKAKVDQIFAPMPGLVLEVKFSEGDTIAKGESVIILEAMKMENIIKSPIDGVVKQVHVKKDQTIEKNTLIISFES